MIKFPDCKYDQYSLCVVQGYLLYLFVSVFHQQIGLMNDCVLWHISDMFVEVYNPSINVYTNWISS